jgi:hypothetical protein
MKVYIVWEHKRYEWPLLMNIFADKRQAGDMYLA